MKTFILIALFPIAVFSAHSDKYSPTQLEWARMYFDGASGELSGVCGWSFLVLPSGVTGHINHQKNATYSQVKDCKDLSKRTYEVFADRYSKWKWLKYKEVVKAF